MSKTLSVQKKQKTAAVYDRWLHTLGGGEQVAFAYAECLRDFGYKVNILTHRSVDLRQAEQRLNVDLHDIELCVIPSLPDYQLSKYTEKYDLFVSNSFLDYIPNRSKYGLLSVFFPSRIKVSLYEYLKRAHIIPSLRRFFIYPSYFEGFRFDEFINGKMYKWLGQESNITFNRSVDKIKIQIKAEQLAISCIDNIRFFYNDEEVRPKFRSINLTTNIMSYLFESPKKSKSLTLKILLPDSVYSQTLALLSVQILDFRYMLYNLFKIFFPSWEMRLHGGPSAAKFSDIDSYDKVIAISEFSRLWIKKYWGISSGLLYPPINTTSFHSSKRKKNMIAHVGRFFVGGHSKKQLDLVRVFKRMVDKGMKDWELHLVGGVAEGQVHQHYIDKVHEEAAGYPVFFHFNAPFSEVKRILSEAKIYWHATGLDEDNSRYPIRLEHFGITTVEAMASGCVPVVIREGGQTEIVTEGSGFTWKTREELSELTTKLINDPVLLAQLSKGALERSKYFDKSHFAERLKKFLPQ